MRADCIAVVGEARFRIDGATALGRYRREAADISAGCRDCGGEWVGTQPVRLGVDQEVSWPRSAVRAFALLRWRTFYLMRIIAAWTHELGNTFLVSRRSQGRYRQN
jgi:hypothetical protein